MLQKSSITRTRWIQISRFIIHLRWHYQLLILSGGFLLGGYFSDDIRWPLFLLQFANVHLLLFGGATAYNSFCDKDDGPVGGLKHPLPLPSWTGMAAFGMQIMGLIGALATGWLFAIVYLLSMLLFWFYSSPLFRWKGRPLLSLAAIGISSGADALLMGYLAAGNEIVPSHVLQASAGAALLIVSLYPVSQLFQLDEDYRRGDKTFAIRFGLPGVVYFFAVAFAGGVLLTTLAIALKERWVGIAFLSLAASAGYWIYRQLGTLQAEKTDYAKVMRIKYVCSLSFVSFILVLLICKHII